MEKTRQEQCRDIRLYQDIAISHYRVLASALKTGDKRRLADVKYFPAKIEEAFDKALVQINKMLLDTEREVVYIKGEKVILSKVRMMKDLASEGMRNYKEATGKIFRVGDIATKAKSSKKGDFWLTYYEGDVEIVGFRRTAELDSRIVVLKTLGENMEMEYCTFAYFCENFDKK